MYFYIYLELIYIYITPSCHKVTLHSCQIKYFCLYVIFVAILEKIDIYVKVICLDTGLLVHMGNYTQV